MVKGRVAYFIVFCTAVVLAAHWVTRITDSPITGDANQRLRLAINLEHDGVMSMSVAPPFHPSMYREPVPVWLLALSIKTVDFFMGRAETQMYFEGERARYLKYLSLFWFALLSATVFWAGFLFTSSVYMSLLATLLVNVPLPMTPSGPMALGINSLYGEQSTAALLMLGSVFLALAATRGRIRDAAAAGFFFGLLALSNAVAFYVFIGIVLLLFCLRLIPSRFLPHRLSWRTFAVLLLAYGVVVSPWIYRNYKLFDSLQIAERGGIVLYVRAVKNQMSAEEYLGSFYVWAPGRRDLVGRILGFSEADLQKGGRLQRLNRAAQSDFADSDLAAEQAGDSDGAVSFYRRARAERVRLENELTARGVSEPTVEADRILQEQAIALIKEHPARHLAMTIPFLWRGAFSSSLVLLCCLVYALATRRTEFVLFVLPALGAIAFYALFSHFLGRYSVPMVPVAVVAGVVLVSPLGELLKRRLGEISWIPRANHFR